MEFEYCITDDSEEFDASDRTSKKRRSLTQASNISPADLMLLPYMGLRIIYAPRMKLSSYLPCSYMMDYILHHINLNLVDNLDFNRHAPDYHPYILRLYYAIVFWIQCLRAGHSVAALPLDQHQFLFYFLDAFPPKSLPIAGPLLPLFQTLCSSQPEIPTFGKLYPIIPATAGPETRDSFTRDNISSSVLPNVPGIIALLEHLNSLINADQPTYPDKGQHLPVAANTTQNTVFGHHTYEASQLRSARDSWPLVSSGLQYPCEADARLNEVFAERYGCFRFPVTAADDNLEKVASFLSMDRSLAWFSQVKRVAASAAAFFKDSATLDDCPATGAVINQIVVKIQEPASIPTVPACSADENALFPFSLRLYTTARRLPALSEAMAAVAQTNVEMFPSHPYLSSLGAKTREGEFWDIRPIEKSQVDYTSYLGLSDVIRKMMKTKI